MRASR